LVFVGRNKTRGKGGDQRTFVWRRSALAVDKGERKGSRALRGRPGDDGAGKKKKHASCVLSWEKTTKELEGVDWASGRKEPKLGFGYKGGPFNLRDFEFARNELGRER
jgi:hypothetical protein